jgi:putative selenate reductase molybdopterin-binding subunit
MTAPAAVANAVADALGIRIRELPLTPERVWRALREAEEA